LTVFEADKWWFVTDCETLESREVVSDLGGESGHDQINTIQAKYGLTISDKRRGKAVPCDGFLFARSLHAVASFRKWYFE
jgi:hypothetical protein